MADLLLEIGAEELPAGFVPPALEQLQRDLAKALEPIWMEGTAALGYEPALWLEPGRFFVAPSGFAIRRV